MPRITSNRKSVCKPKPQKHHQCPTRNSAAPRRRRRGRAPSRQAACRSLGRSRASKRIQAIRDHPLAAHSHGNSFSGSEAAHRAAAGRNPRITACARLHSSATPPPIATAKGQSRRPGARNWCFGDPAKEKKTPRNSSLSDRNRRNSRRPQGMRRTPPVGAQVRRARAKASSQRAAAAPRLTSPQDLPLDRSCRPSSRSVPRCPRSQNRAQARAPGAPAAPSLPLAREANTQQPRANAQHAGTHITNAEAASNALSAQPALQHATFPRRQQDPTRSLAQQVFREKEQRAAFAHIPRR